MALTRQTSSIRHSSLMCVWQFRLARSRNFASILCLRPPRRGPPGVANSRSPSTSGTNAFHGSVFEFFRNDVFDARQPIDNLNPVQPPFRLNQFGGTFGGPITKDKTFFFVSYEGYRQRLGQDRTRGHGARHLHLGFRLSSQTSPLYQRLLRQRSAHPVEVLRPHPPRPQ